MFEEMLADMEFNLDVKLLASKLPEKFLEQSDSDWMEARTVYTRQVFSFRAGPLPPALPLGGGGVCDASGLPEPGASLSMDNTASSQPGDAHAGRGQSPQERHIPGLTARSCDLLLNGALL